MQITGVLKFLKQKKLAVIATRHHGGGIEAALVGFALNDDHLIIFDTSKSSRKAENLRKDPRLALVVGWDNQTTVQIEGSATEPIGVALADAQNTYYKTWPDGRARAISGDTTYFVVRMEWLRYSNFGEELEIVEFKNSGTGWV